MTLIKMVTLCAVVIANTTFAETSKSIDNRYDICIKKSNNVTAELDDCNSNAIAEWDKKLNENYKVLVNISDEKQTKKLKATQRAWIDFRDKEMAYLRTIATGGSIDALTQSGVYLELERRRVFNLYNHIQGVGETVGEFDKVANDSDEIGTDSAIDRRYHACIEKSNDTTMGVDDCNRIAITEWDKELNNSYKALKKDANEKQKKALKQVQLAWIDFRDKEMNYIHSAGTGGSIDILIRGGAKLRIIRQRALTLQSYIQGIGEDTAGVGLNEHSGDEEHYGSKYRTKKMCHWGEACGEHPAESNLALTLIDSDFGVAAAQIYNKEAFSIILQIKNTSKCEKLGSERAEQLKLLIDQDFYTATFKCLRKEEEYAVYEYSLHGSQASKLSSHFKKATKPVEVLFEDGLKLRFSSKGFTKAYRSLKKRA